MVRRNINTFQRLHEAENNIRSSAIAEVPRDALGQLKSCQTAE